MVTDYSLLVIAFATMYAVGWLYTTFQMVRDNIFGVHLSDDMWELTKALFWCLFLWWLILPTMIIQKIERAGKKRW